MTHIDKGKHFTFLFTHAHAGFAYTLRLLNAGALNRRFATLHVLVDATLIEASVTKLKGLPTALRLLISVVVLCIGF